MVQEILVPSKAEFIRQIQEWGDYHPLHTHPYLDYVFNEKMDDINTVKRYTDVLYIFCERFHDGLLGISRNTRDEAIRRAMIENLYDEFGSGNKDRAHLCLMRQLLYSMGYSDTDISNIRINPGSQKFMERFLSICDNEHPLTAIGCLCVGAECNGSRYFTKIFEAFKKKPCLRDANLHILEIHAGDDVVHREHMLALIDSYLDDPESRQMLWEGFQESIHLFSQLWTSMLFYEGLNGNLSTPVA